MWHPSTLCVFFLQPYAFCLDKCQRKSCKTHISAKLLHCLYQQQCDNLEAMRHIARPPSLHAERCQSCHLAGELHAFHLYLSSLSLLSSTVCHHLSPCLVLSLLVFLTPAIFSTSSAPLCLCIICVLHLYLPVHPPPSRPGSHTETRGSVKIERGMRKRKEHIGRAWWSAVFCSLSLSFVLSSLLVSYHCLRIFSSCRSLLLSDVYTPMQRLASQCAHTHNKHIHTITCTHMQTRAHTHSGGSPPSSSSGCSIWTVVFNQCLRGQRG